MVKTKKELRKYIREDMKINSLNLKIFKTPIQKYLISLRKLEYYLNTKHKFLALIQKIKYKQLSLKLGFSIPPNVCGYGLRLCHKNIVINSKAKIGCYCTFHGNNCIGNSYDNGLAPIVSDYCSFGFGSVAIGEITINQNTVVGANATITKNIPQNSKVICFNKII